MRLALITVGLSIATLAPAQVLEDTLFSVTGSEPHGWFGVAARGAGDVDGDGYGDFVVGAPHWEDSDSVPGYVTVFSGRNGSVLHTWTDTSAGTSFGQSVDGAGDVNGDGHADIVVGAIGSGMVYIYSGADGSLLRSLVGSVGDRFGWRVVGAGDVDNDGFADIAVAAPHAAGIAMESGVVSIFSGATGAAIRTWNGFLNEAGLGDVLCGGMDVNGDGIPDLVALSYNSPFLRMVRVLSGGDGSVIHVFTGPSGSRFGEALSLGDVDADGHADVAISSFSSDDGALDAGRIDVFSGMSGLSLRVLLGQLPSQYLGERMSISGDVDGDGHADIAAMHRPNGQEPTIAVYSGSDETLLVEIHKPSGERIYDLTLARDMNGDGKDELIVGMVAWPSYEGRVDVYGELRDPIALLIRLIADVAELNLKNGISNSLDAKLEAALRAITDAVDNNDQAAANALDAFIQAVQAQSGNWIEVQDAIDLISDATLIITLLTS